MAWENLGEGHAKINIHFVEFAEPLQNGNLNSLGIIVRNVAGVKLWGAACPVKGMTELPALIWGVQSGILASMSLGFHKTHIELDNREAYDTIRVQEFIHLPPDLEETFGQFNTLFSNQFVEDMTVRQVSVIPVERNATARYMASYGMNNLKVLVQAPGVFGNLQYYLERDMGMILPYPEFELLDNLGEGEVINFSPPEPPTWIMHNNFAIVSPLIDGAINCNAEMTIEMIKGKGICLTGYAFMQGGLITHKAQRILNEGILIPFLKEFSNKVINMDKDIFKGVYARDLLDSAVRG